MFNFKGHRKIKLNYSFQKKRKFKLLKKRLHKIYLKKGLLDFN